VTRGLSIYALHPSTGTLMLELAFRLSHGAVTERVVVGWGNRRGREGIVGSNLIWQVLPPYQIIGQLCILRQTLNVNFKYEIFYRKIIPLESSFEYESNGIIFI
jgi:hypothetical protein